MSLKSTSEMLANSENLERDLNAARTGERLTFRPYSDASNVCRKCNAFDHDHIRQNGILFCPEYALQIMWGK